jgi:hypothetical protein
MKKAKAAQTGLSLVLMVLTSINAHALEKDGGDNGAGNNGDMLAAQFYGTAVNVLEEIKKQSKCSACQVAKKFEQVVGQTTVESVPVLFDGNVEKDAINFPSPSGSRILVSRARWQQMDNIAKAHLVLHEYLVLAGLEKSDQYTVSHICLEMLSAEDRLTNVVPPMNPTESGVLYRLLNEKAYLSCFEKSGTSKKENKIIAKFVSDGEYYDSFFWTLDGLRFYRYNLVSRLSNPPYRHELENRKRSFSTILKETIPSHYDVLTGGLSYGTTVYYATRPIMTIRSFDLINWEIILHEDFSKAGLSVGQELKCKTVLIN